MAIPWGGVSVTDGAVLIEGGRRIYAVAARVLNHRVFHYPSAALC